jgi:hypothetical protein
MTQNGTPPQTTSFPKLYEMRNFERAVLVALVNNIASEWATPRELTIEQTPKRGWTMGSRDGTTEMTAPFDNWLWTLSNMQKTSTPGALWHQLERAAEENLVTAKGPAATPPCIPIWQQMIVNRAETSQFANDGQQ